MALNIVATESRPMKESTMKTIVTTCALIAVLAGSSAFAGATDLKGTGASSRTCMLQPTDRGFDVDAKGVAQLSKSFRGEGIAIKVQATLEDKTLMIVSVMTKGGTFDIGSFSMLLGVGLFEMQTFKDGFSHAFPVDGIEGIMVRTKEATLLKGGCATLTSKL